MRRVLLMVTKLVYLLIVERPRDRVLMQRAARCIMQASSVDCPRQSSLFAFILHPVSDSGLLSRSCNALRHNTLAVDCFIAVSDDCRSTKQDTGYTTVSERAAKMVCPHACMSSAYNVRRTPSDYSVTDRKRETSNSFQDEIDTSLSCRRMNQQTVTSSSCSAARPTT